MSTTGWSAASRCPVKHGGTFMGVPPTGTQIALPGITILHYRDGRCVERWTTSDMLGLLVQIGAIPRRTT